MRELILLSGVLFCNAVNLDTFFTFAQTIDCGYMLELPRRGGLDEYPQSIFWNKNTKNIYTPVNSSFTT